MLPRTGEKRRAEETTGVELMATVAEAEEMIITIRKNVGGITVRESGSMTLFDRAAEGSTPT